MSGGRPPYLLDVQPSGALQNQSFTRTSSQLMVDIRWMSGHPAEVLQANSSPSTGYPTGVDGSEAEDVWWITQRTVFLIFRIKKRPDLTSRPPGTVDIAMPKPLSHNSLRLLVLHGIQLAPSTATWQSNMSHMLFARCILPLDRHPALKRLSYSIFHPPCLPNPLRNPPVG